MLNLPSGLPDLTKNSGKLYIPGSELHACSRPVFHLPDLLNNLTPFTSVCYRIPSTGCLNGTAIAAVSGGKLSSKVNSMTDFLAHR